ncbi:flagellar hook-basal body protein [Thermocrinis sp.]
MPIDYQGIYVLSSGVLVQQRKLETLTHNLANANTPAFKSELILAGVWDTPNGQREGDISPENPTNNFLYPVVERVHTLLVQGPLRQTSNPLDLAIEGDGFFALRSGGEVLYTRKGNFRIDSEGYLVNELGMRVLDENGREIRVEGDLSFASEGSVFSNGNFIGRLGVYTLANPQKVGRDLFTGEPQQAQNLRVMQGFLEDSNVNAIMEMARLIETHRAHETYANLIRALDQVQEKVSNNLV